MLSFIHSPQRGPHTGALHHLHYHCSFTPADRGETLTHHALLARLTDLGCTLPITTRNTNTPQQQTAVAWQQCFADKDLPILFPGDHLTVPPDGARPRRARSLSQANAR
jgi:hypothetical protein